MNLFSPNSPLGRWMAFFLDALLISIAWFLLSIPVVTIGASTAALHKVAYNWMHDREGCTLSAFWEAFRSNLKTGTLMWLLLLVPLALILFSAYAIWIALVSVPVAVKWLTLIAGVIWLGTAVYAFPLQALFENRPVRTVSNALRISVSYIISTVILDVLVALAVFATLVVPFGAPFYIPLCAFLGARPVWGVFRKVMRISGVSTDPEGDKV